MKKSTEEQRAETMGWKTCGQTAHYEQVFPRGTCQQSVCWAEAQVRIPAAVTPGEG